MSTLECPCHPQGWEVHEYDCGRGGGRLRTNPIRALKWWHAKFSETLHGVRHHVRAGPMPVGWHAKFSETLHGVRHHMRAGPMPVGWHAKFSETLHGVRHHMRAGPMPAGWHAKFSETSSWCLASYACQPNPSLSQSIHLCWTKFYHITLDFSLVISFTYPFLTNYSAPPFLFPSIRHLINVLMCWPSSLSKCGMLFFGIWIETEYHLQGIPLHSRTHSYSSQ
ncbi:hypothetical protein B0H14DRAFT_3049517 [Mycena olivaceomarginata]|nr:hypothetical protein B0H14DRAFT_3049517 [Mycena olivaceomarginata]